MKSLRLAFLILMVSNFGQAQHSNTITLSPGTGGGTTTGFIVQRSATAGGPYTVLCGGTGQPLCPTLANPIYVDKAGLVDGAVWFYTALATGPGGNSGPSSEAKATTPFLPPSAASIVSIVSQ